MIPTRIVVATSNAHKVEELQQLVQHLGIQSTLLPWSDVAVPFDIDETGHTFEENAYIKAIAVYEQTGLPVIADDSGLEVDVLAGAPGVRSARYAGEDATDEDNRRKLLVALTNKNAVTLADAKPHAAGSPLLHGPRSAAFRCVLCYTDGHRTVFGEGSVKGHITDAERGDSGFGYDALFVPENKSSTFAEMTSAEKHAISHRARAFDNLMHNMQSSTCDELPQTMFLIQAAIAAATNNEALLRSAARRVIVSREDGLRLYEAVLQTYLFAGYPAGLDGLVIVAEEIKSIQGTSLTLDVEAFDVEAFRERGTALCRMIYGNVFDKLMTKLEEVSPDLREWMIVEGYGKTLSRKGLDIVTREMCIVGVLAATGRTAQLYSHVRGAILAGASVEDLALCVDVVTECVSARHADSIRTIMESVST